MKNSKMKKGTITHDLGSSKKMSKEMVDVLKVKSHDISGKKASKKMSY